MGEVTHRKLQHGNAEANADQRKYVLQDVGVFPTLAAADGQAQRHSSHHGHDQHARKQGVYREPFSRDGQQVEALGAQQQQQKPADYRSRDEGFLKDRNLRAQEYAQKQEPAQKGQAFQ